MKKRLLEWKIPKDLEKNISSKIPLKKKIVAYTLVIIISSLIVFLAYFFTNKKVSVGVLALYSFGYIFFIFLLYFIASLFKGEIRFYENKIFHRLGASGHTIRYTNIEAYAISKINEGGNTFIILMLKYQLAYNKKEEYLFAEIDKVINEKAITSIFDDQNIPLDPSIKESEYFKKKIYRFFS